MAGSASLTRLQSRVWLGAQLSQCCTVTGSTVKVTGVAVDRPQKTHFPVRSSDCEQASGHSWLLTRDITYLPSGPFQGAGHNMAAGFESQSFPNIISEVTSHRIGCILFLRVRHWVQPTLKGRGLHKSMNASHVS